MPLHLEAITEHETNEIFTWILQDALQNVNDAFATQKDGKTYALASYPLYDTTTGSEIGKYVFTIYSNLEEQCNEILDLDIVLNNSTPTRLHFGRKLSQSSDSNEYYEVLADEKEQHLIVETVNRYTVPGEIEGKDIFIYASAFPFQLTIFETVEEYNKYCGFETPIQVGNTELKVHGLSTTFACPGDMMKQNDDEDPWSFVVGEIKEYRGVTIAFGSIKREVYLVTLHSALGDLPTIVGKEIFDTSKIGVGKIIGMNTSVKVNFIKDKYPKAD